jgi:hypothetical protein
MAADEYYDAIGKVLSYVLSAEDFIIKQKKHNSGKHFLIDRDGTNLEFYAEADKRYFMLLYQFSLVNQIVRAYQDDSEILSKHVEEYNIDESDRRRENYYSIVAFERIKDLGEDEAESIVTDIRSFAVHSDCRIEASTTQSPRKDDTNEEIWDGILIAGLLYPYENDFGPREYEQVAQEVISVGNQIDESMKKLDVMKEIGFRND